MSHGSVLRHLLCEMDKWRNIAAAPRMLFPEVNAFEEVSVFEHF